MNIKKHFKKVVLLTTLLLSACGGGEGSKQVEPEVVKPMPPSVTVSADDLRISVTAGATNQIVLNHFVKSAAVGTNYISNVSLQSQTANCREHTLDSGVLIVQPKNMGSCVFEYTVSNSANDEAQATGVIQVAVAQERASSTTTEAINTSVQSLAPVSVVLIQGDADVLIDLPTALASQWPTGVVSISEQPTQLGGSGSFYADLTNNTITISSDREVGNQRIYYSITADESTYLGVIDVSVATMRNQGLNATDFVWPEKVVESEVVTIDLNDYVADLDDGQSLKLLEVKSFNADVAITGDLTFSFSAVIPEVNYVTYSISDGYGSVEMATVTINVTGPFPPLELLNARGKVIASFVPPYTLDQTTIKGINIANTEEDPAHISPIPMYDYHTANAVCAAFSGRLPTASELNDLFTQEGNLYDNQGWPVVGVYFSSDESADNNDEPIVTGVNMATGDTSDLFIGSSNQKATIGYLTCIDDTPVKVSILNDFLVVNQTRKLRAEFLTESGVVVNYEKPIDWSITSPSDTSLFDISGNATLDSGQSTLKAHAPGWLKLSVEGVYDNLTHNKNLEAFINLFVGLQDFDPTFESLNPNSGGSCDSYVATDGDSNFNYLIGGDGSWRVYHNCDSPEGTTFLNLELGEDSWASIQTENSVQLDPDGTYKLHYWMRKLGDPDEYEYAIKIYMTNPIAQEVGGGSYSCVGRLEEGGNFGEWGRYSCILSPNTSVRPEGPDLEFTKLRFYISTDEGDPMVISSQRLIFQIDDFVLQDITDQ
ncbi:hypothetical protein RC083_06785 [Pseudoalteromonas haloplanktis]|uniref:Uncharacterized protein n=1 Tax=Pseudoalteromonas haloplanktis TaxID=228 RepID=A0ABU1B9Y9_PSEHA|nr:hypothetical protein [Pseudoalteromonas haloplanktis]MDQ9091296.1 hypothetical protein [Pseudoalteromonas haloplanktis]